MEPALNLFTVLLATGVVQGVVAGVALWRMPQGRPFMKHLLAALLMVVVIDLAYGLLLTSRYIFTLPHLVRLNTPVVFLYGPLVYLYIRSATDPKLTWRRGYLRHGLPVLACILLLLPLYVQDATAKTSYLTLLFTDLPLEAYLFGAAKRKHMGAYLLLASAWLWQRRSALQESSRSTIFPIALLGLFAVVWLLDVADYLFDFRLGTAADGMQFAMAAAFLVLVTYLAVTRPHWLVGEAASPSPAKYLTSSLSGSEGQAHLARLKACMETDAVYLDPNLTLADLARCVGLSPHHVSQVLNELAGQNFATFVNGYRVRAVQDRMATDAARTTLAAIAFSCGFNATSTFNKAFKKHTGTTPSRYRQQLATSAPQALST